MHCVEHCCLPHCMDTAEPVAAASLKLTLTPTLTLTLT